MLRWVLFVVLLLGATPIFAQEREDNGFILNYLEDTISTDNFVLRLSGVSGLLASEADVEKITIADRDSVWLTIQNARIKWSRAALLRGRVEIDELKAKSIQITRRPLPDRTSITPEATPFSLPDLPVALILKELAIDEVVLEEPVLGFAARISARGNATLQGGSLDADIDVARLDAPGGRFGLKGAFEAETRNVALDLKLSEPQGGLISTLLNIENRPAIDLALKGAGPLEKLDLVLALDVESERIVTGRTRLRGVGDNLAYDMNLLGDLRPMVPVDIRPFFGRASKLEASGLKLGAGGFTLQDLELATARLRLEGSLRTTPDGFLRQAKFEGRLGDGVTPTILPGSTATLLSGRFDLDFGNAQNGRWVSEVDLDRLSTESFSAGNVSLSLLGSAFNLDEPEAREISFTTRGVASGLTSEDRDIRAALGPEITFGGEGRWSEGTPLIFKDFALLGNGILSELSGQLENWIFSGKLASNISDLAPLSGIAGRDLRGAISLALEGSVSPLISGFDLSLIGDAQDLTFDKNLDPLLDGVTRLSGQVTRDEAGFRTRDLELSNTQLQLRTDGVISSDETDFNFLARLRDLSLASRKLTGSASLRGSAKAEKGTPIAIKAAAIIPSGSLLKRSLRQARVSLDGALDGSRLSADVTGTGVLDGQNLSLKAGLESSGARHAMRELEVIAGGAEIRGDLVQRPDGLITGDLRIEADDIKTLALLALQEGTGALEAEVALMPENGQQNASVSAKIAEISIGENRLTKGSTSLEIADLLGVPVVNGSLAVARAVGAGVELRSLVVSAQSEERTTTVTAGMSLGSGARLRAKGDLSPLGDGFAVGLSDLNLVQNSETIFNLAKPSKLSIRGGMIELESLELSAGAEGRLAMQGAYGERVSLSFDMDALPLSVANAIDPSLGLSGVLSGKATADGNPDEPAIAFTIEGRDLSAEALKASGAPLLDFDAKGATTRDVLDFTSALTGGGLAASLDGKFPLRRGDMDLEANLDRFPLALLERVAGRPGLAGFVTGKAQISGPKSDPRVGFDVNGEGLSARIVRINRIAPVTARASGSYERNLVSLTSARLQNSDGMSLDISGVAPLLSRGLDIKMAGRLPLSVANVVLAERGARASGVAEVTLQATGRITQPAIAGAVRLNGGTIVDPQTNIRLEDVALNGDFSGTRFNISQASARNSRGGTINLSGNVSLDQPAGLPIDMRSTIAGFRYTDGEVFSTTVNADLTITGALLRQARLGGDINLGRTEVTLPEGFGASGVATLDVAHINAPFEVRETLARAERRLDGVRVSEASSGDIALGLRLNAPRKIFLRGRGVDAELGGQVLIGGTTGAPVPVGQFDLIRGRINLLGNRIDLTEGAISMTGTLDPQLGLVARTQSGAVTAVVSVEGPVSAPEIKITSTPELPQDEVLARILFDRPLAELSGLQVARLAAAAAELSGRGGPGFLEQLRRNTGLDDLDFRTDADGATALTVGKYLRSNLYSTIEVNSRGESEVSLNVDISDALKARTSVDLRGNTSVGIFYEKDY